MTRQPAVNSKVIAFWHSKLAGVQILKMYMYGRFWEKFPAVNMRDVLSFHDDTESVHCHNHKHVPKLYYFGNNMDPGPITPPLMVIFIEFSPYFLI